jgi:phage-related protein
MSNTEKINIVIESNISEITKQLNELILRLEVDKTSAFGGMLNVIMEVIEKAKKLTDTIKNIGAINEFLVKYEFHQLKDIFETLGVIAGPIFTGIGQVVTGAFNMITNHPIIAAITAIIAIIILLYNNCEWFRDLIDGVISFIISILGGLWNFISNFVSGIINFFTESIPNAITIMLGFFSNMPYYIGYAIGAVFGLIASFGVNILNWATTEIPKFIGSVISFFTELPGKIWGILCDVVTKIGNWGIDLASKGLEAAKSLFTSIVNTIKELPSEMIRVGTDLVKGIWDGIKGMGTWIKDKIKEFCKGLLDGFLGFFKIKSPSRLFRDEIGHYLPQGIAVGFIAEMPNTEKEIEKSLSSMNDSIQGAMEVEATKNMALQVQGDVSYSGLGTQLSMVLEDTMHNLLEKILLQHNIIIGGKVVQRELTPLVNRQLALATSRGGRQ